MNVWKAVIHYIKNTDLYLLIIALCCSGYGMLLVRSATQSTGSNRCLIVQGVAIFIGVAAFVVLSLIDLEALSRYWAFFLIANVVLQLLLIPFGYEAGGQRNWINLGITSIQPGELGKILFVVSFSAHLASIREHISEWRGVLVLGMHALLMMLVIVLTSGDSGMAIAYFCMAIFMMFAAGLSLRWVFGGIGLALLSVPILWNFVLQDYQKNRILVLFDPTIDPNTAYQTTQGQIALGSGQWSGQGLGAGTMTQMGLIPEERTDLIFAVAGEELGFVGCALIIFLLALLIARIFYVSYRANTTFSAMLSVGIAAMFLFQTFMNIFMVIGLLPVMGLTLPLFSYGGTSVVTMFAALGIVAGVRMRVKPSWLQ